MKEPTYGVGRIVGNGAGLRTLVYVVYKDTREEPELRQLTSVDFVKEGLLAVLFQEGKDAPRLNTLLMTWEELEKARIESEESALSAEEDAEYWRKRLVEK